MNERLQELVDKAISDVDYIRDDDFTNEELSKMYIPDCFAEKFAELIVRECTSLFDGTKEMKTVGMLTHSQIVEQIQKHFGVER